MIKQLTMAVAVSFALTGCGTLGIGNKAEPVKAEKGKDVKIVTEFLGGTIRMTYTPEGEFESLSSTGHAKVSSTLPGAADEAYIVATLRARKQIVEFMKTEVESEKMTDAVFESLQNATNEGRSTGDSKVNSRIAGKVTENIKQKASAILRGTYVADKAFDQQTQTVRVTVNSSFKDVQTAKDLSKLMGN